MRNRNILNTITQTKLDHAIKPYPVDSFEFVLAVPDKPLKPDCELLEGMPYLEGFVYVHKGVTYGKKEI